jgi:glycolate oxidase FAD binding subunit
LVLYMEIQNPQTAGELAGLLAEAASAGRGIRVGGAFTKDRMAGPVAAAEVTISTSAMNAVLQYEPRDLTISVQAGASFAGLSALLAENNQMIPLDPPFFDRATVGGVIAANTSGPRRRLYGTARDLVIGMEFAMLDGKLVKTGGMVVKNVAGLDMGKLMIGSFGTLAAITVVNFKLIPIPEETATFVLQYRTLDDVIEARDAILKGVLQPASLDLLNPAASEVMGLRDWCLIVQVCGNSQVISRYSVELANPDLLADGLFMDLREFTPKFLEVLPRGTVVRISSTLSELKGVMKKLEVPAISRAGSGVTYAYFASPEESILPGKAVIEYAPAAEKDSLDLWPNPGSDFAMMKKIKHMFDPQNLLNPGRLYGRI